MKKADFLKKIQNLGEYENKAQARKVFNVFVESLKSSLINEGDFVKLKGIGTLKVLKFKSRKRINPSTGEVFVSPEYLAVKLKKEKKTI